MNKKSTSNNLGFSLITAIIALAAVTATTAYLMNISKNATLSSASAKATIYIESERSRIATALADNNTCMRVGNFSGQAPTRSAITELLSANGAVLVKQGSSYIDGTLRVESIQTRVASTGVAGVGADPNAAEIGSDNGYVLQINYADNTLNNTRSSYSGKKQSIIIIPMYMKVVAGAVVECYSLAQNSNINLAVRASCSPASPPTNKSSLLNLGGGSIAIESDCEHSLTLATPDPQGDFTACTSTAPNTAPSNFSALKGWDLVNSKMDIPASKCSGISTNCTILGQAAYSITNSVASCSYGGGVRDGACAAGQILYHSSGTGTVCTTVNCPGVFSFVNAVISTGATCITAPATTCGANQYVKVFNATGADTCDILPTMSGSCAPGSFGRSITRNNATANGRLDCAPYNKTKSCPFPSNHAFATALSASPIASCTVF